MKDSKNLVIGLLCAVVCIMAVAYAAFSTTLNINGTATISSNWSVEISSIECEVVPVEGGETVEGGAVKAVTKSINGTTAQFDMTFYQPGDTGTCTVTITNNGSIPAVVAEDGVKLIVKDASGNTATADDEDDPIRYNLDGIEAGDKLGTTADNNTNTYTIEVEYADIRENGNSVAPTEGQKSKTITVSIEYVQDFSAA